MEDEKKYNPNEFESKMFDLWEKENVYSTSIQSSGSKREKAFCLSMFPYPSGAGLHVGHVRIYTGTDVLARYFKMIGRDVLHPMGWDAFGLPAENAAIKAKKNPIDMVPGNIANFKRQMNMLGLSYDWKREFSTTDPSYYKWTQWLFIQFFKMGLLYKRNTPIHWCPKCKTGLAEEEVLANGTHERCGSEITKKELPQWIFRITAYAEQLLDDLKLLDWPKGILEMQKNWIGKKEGVNVQFKAEGSNLNVECFTTRIDTLFGVVAVVVAPEHQIAVESAKENADVKTYIDEAQKKSAIDREDNTKKKTGVFTTHYVLHPLTDKKIPVWVGDYVLGSVGTGAVMVVPAHDQRDYDFAKVYGLDVIPVVAPQKGEKQVVNEAYENDGIAINSGKYSDLSSYEARKAITADLEGGNKGKKMISYHLRDWIFSRQRYWGEPIPMVHCEQCAKKGTTVYNKKFTIPDEVQTANKGWIPLTDKQLPLELPYTASYEPTDTGESPLSAIPGFTETTCPVCGGKAQRETDTMPNWAGSCWYFMRFAQEKRGETLPEFMQGLQNSSWMPVDWYLGGAEHAVLHLLYARFWVKALRDLGLVNYAEPFLRLRNVGMVLAEDHRKMSKSWGNTINPDDVVAQYGADTLRMYEMFMAPFNMEIAWSTAALQGGHRFLKRVWALYTSQNHKIEKSNPELVNKLNKTIQKVGDDIAQTKFNTAIAALMEFLNAYEATPELQDSEAKKFIQIIAPFAPFITEKIWRDVFKENTSVHLSTWPTQTEVDIKETSVEVPVQVNGKFRGIVKVPVGAEQEEIVKVALVAEGIQKYLEGKKYRLIYVKGKICNFVLL
ncbi:MAG: leucine--tRNA ligase [Candidatus Roizmanbacteria bacterium]|nr:leucine--tRNA ligase [Candidatus Roizmanbacteria bacterium]